MLFVVIDAEFPGTEKHYFEFPQSTNEGLSIPNLILDA
jgi:hypothetical protein